MLFTNLKALLIQEANKEKEETTLFIEKGYRSDWNDKKKVITGWNVIVPLKGGNSTKTAK